MDSCGSIGGVNSHKGDTDDYKHEVTYNNTLHKVSSEMLLGLIYGLVNPHTLIVIIISCTSFVNLFMFRYDTQTHTRNGTERSAAHGLATFKRRSRLACRPDKPERDSTPLHKLYLPHSYETRSRALQPNHTQHMYTHNNNNK